MEFAFVEIGLTPDIFWDLTWREFNLIVKHKQKQSEQQWDIARHIGSWSIAPHVKKSIMPQDLIKLSTDKKAKSSIATREEFEKVKALYGKYGKS